MGHVNEAKLLPKGPESRGQPTENHACNITNNNALGRFNPIVGHLLLLSSDQLFEAPIVCHRNIVCNQFIVTFLRGPHFLAKLLLIHSCLFIVFKIVVKVCAIRCQL